MTLVQINHVPETVRVDTSLYLILPENYQLAKKPLEEHKVLFLLHGLSDDGSAWQRYTNIEILARDLGLVVVMPSVGRSLYANMENGQRYFDYVTEEIPTYLRKVFCLNLARENTFIAGLSMGGFGALKAAFMRPEQYFAAGSFSGLVSLSPVFTPEQKLKDPAMMHEFEMVLGGFGRIAGSENDSAVWLKRYAGNPSAFPRLFAACGLDDDLLPLNRYFAAQMKMAGLPYTYTEDQGKHDWHFWQKYLVRFLDWALKGQND